MVAPRHTVGKLQSALDRAKSIGRKEQAHMSGIGHADYVASGRREHRGIGDGGQGLDARVARRLERRRICAQALAMTDFDKHARTYEAVHARSLGPSGETPAYFARYKQRV